MQMELGSLDGLCPVRLYDAEHIPKEACNG